jgi:hypothetical protein
MKNAESVNREGIARQQIIAFARNCGLRRGIDRLRHSWGVVELLLNTHDPFWGTRSHLVPPVADCPIRCGRCSRAVDDAPNGVPDRSKPKDVLVEARDAGEIANP